MERKQRTANGGVFGAGGDDAVLDDPQAVADGVVRSAVSAGKDGDDGPRHGEHGASLGRQAHRRQPPHTILPWAA